MNLQERLLHHFELIDVSKVGKEYHVLLCQQERTEHLEELKFSQDLRIEGAVCCADCKVIFMYK